MSQQKRTRDRLEYHHGWNDGRKSGYAQGRAEGWAAGILEGMRRARLEAGQDLADIERD